MSPGPARRLTVARTAPVSQRVVAGVLPVRVARSLTKPQPVRGWLSGNWLVKTRAASTGRRPHEVDAFIGGQLSAQSRQDCTGDVLGLLPGGVGAFVPDLFQHLVVRHVGPVSVRFMQRKHRGWLPFSSNGGFDGRKDGRRRAPAVLMKLGEHIRSHGLDALGTAGGNATAQRSQGPGGRGRKGVGPVHHRRSRARFLSC